MVTLPLFSPLSLSHTPKQFIRIMPEKTRLKIVHVLLSRGFAGSERSTAESCNQQCKEHDVTLIVRADHRRRGVSVLDHIDSRVNVIELRPRLFTLWQLRSSIKQIQPDVIHCHLRRSTRLVSKLNTSAASVSTLHIDANSPHFLKMDGLICNARWQVEGLPNHYKGKVHKAHNSLTPHPKLNEQKKLELRKQLNVTPETFLIGAVGRYHSSKGWETLIEAFKQTPSRKAALLFFGAGRDESALKQLASGDSRIQFVGYRKDIKDLYQCFDLMVCPSRFEPLPRVMLEGYDAGTPLIASDAGGCKELIDDYGGVCTPVDNVDALAEALADAIACPPKRTNVDLSAHYVENANAEIVRFYRAIILNKKTKIQ